MAIADFVAANTGTGNAGYFSQSGTTGNAVYGFQTGTGVAGNFQISNNGNGNAAVIGQTNGSGTAVYGFQTGSGIGVRAQITSATNASNALLSTTAGTGIAGEFQINNSASSSPALEATSNGTGVTLNVFNNNNTAAATPYGIYSTVNGTAGLTHTAGYFSASGAGNNISVHLDYGHLKATGPAPGFNVIAQAGLTTVTLAGNSTDIKGAVVITGCLANTNTAQFSVSFNKAYAATPVVVLTLTGNTANQVSRLTAATGNVSATGFEIYISNYTGAGCLNISGVTYMVIE